MTSRTIATVHLSSFSVLTLVACAVASSEGGGRGGLPVNSGIDADAAATGGSPGDGSNDSVLDSSTPDTNPPVVPDSGSDPDTGGADISIGPTALPFAVDDYYVPSGFMGDGEAEGLVTWKGGAEAPCNASRAHSEAMGDCHDIDYEPGAAGWGGIYWQYPINNWGSKPGLTLPAGAQAVSFYAKGKVGGETIRFLVGGVGSGDTAYQDSVRINEVSVLTTQWTQYRLVINQAYQAVLGGFGWVASAADNSGGVSFSIDDVRWE